MVKTGADLFSQLEMSDSWHTQNTARNKEIISGYIAKCVTKLPNFHMQDMTLPLEEEVPCLLDKNV
eukprot:4982676-Karenia_brevis.AAC.1